MQVYNVQKEKQEIINLIRKKKILLPMALRRRSANIKK